MEGNTKKNVVLLIPQLRHGGAERVVSRLSFLLKNDYNVTIVIFDDNVITYEAGCEIISIDIPSSSDNRIITKIVNVYRRLKKYKEIKKLNNIHITYSFGDTANLINILSFGSDKKIISIRGYKRIKKGTTIGEKFIFRPISQYLSKKADRIVSVSQLISKTLSKEYYLEKSKIFTIHNGYDLEKIRALAEEELEEEEMRVFSNKVIITAGTFRSEKGYWHLLKAFSIIAQSNKDVRLVILGEDYKNNRKKVEILAEQLHISDLVSILGYKENPYKYLSKARIYVLSSVFEGFPNALVEAMACGLSVVASDCPSGPREILAPTSDVFTVCEDLERSEFGILVERPNPIENYNPEIFEKCDRNLADGIALLLETELNHYYSQKSIMRSGEFGYDVWLQKQKASLQFD